MPRISLKYLLELARWLAREVVRGERLGMSMPGPHLSLRIRRVLGGSIVSHISRTQLALVTTACMLIAAIFSAGTFVHAQTKSQIGPAFEVASIRLEERTSSSVDRGGKSGPGGTRVGPGGALLSLPPGEPIGAELDYSDTLFALIIKAYGIQGCASPLTVDCSFVSGGPDWLKKDRFALKAKIPAGTPNYKPIEFMRGEAKQLNLMLRRLLEERFGLTVHSEQRTMPVFALTVAPQGAKLQKAVEAKTVTFPDGTTLTSNGWNIGPVVNNDRALRMHVNGRSWEQMASALVPILGRPVLDRTGLTDTYDFTVDYERDPDGRGALLHELAGPSLFTAFQQQLGIKIESTRAPVDVLVIDSARAPSEN